MGGLEGEFSVCFGGGEVCLGMGIAGAGGDVGGDEEEGAVVGAEDEDFWGDVCVSEDCLGVEWWHCGCKVALVKYFAQRVCVRFEKYC